MNPELPTLSEPVEIGGVSFQTMISSSVLTIPEKTLNHTTSFQLGMKITNNSHQDYYFLRFPYYLDIQQYYLDTQQYMNGELRQVLHLSCTDSWYSPRDIHVAFVKSGKSHNLLYKGKIAWDIPYDGSRYKKNRKKKKFSRPPALQREYSPGEEATYQLRVSIDIEYYETCFLSPFNKKPPSYRIKGKYEMSENTNHLKSEGSFFDGSQHIPHSILDKMWVGIVHTPFIEFQLV